MGEVLYGARGQPRYGGRYRFFGAHHHRRKREATTLTQELT